MFRMESKVLEINGRRRNSRDNEAKRRPPLKTGSQQQALLTSEETQKVPVVISASPAA